MIPKYKATEDELEQWEEQSLEGLHDYTERHAESRRRSKHLKRVLATRQKVPKPVMLRTAKAAKYLAISEWKLRQLVLSGQIPCVKSKYWTFAITDLDSWIKANREREVL